jgi:hypothetical protein
MDLKNLWFDGVGWIQLAKIMVQWQDFVNTVVNLQIPQKQEVT